MGFKDARLNAGLRVADVMKEMDVSDAAVYQWETGVTTPRPDKLVKLAKLYGCTVDDLLSDHSVPESVTQKTDI